MTKDVFPICTIKDVFYDYFIVIFKIYTCMLMIYHKIVILNDVVYVFIGKIVYLIEVSIFIKQSF